MNIEDYMFALFERNKINKEYFDLPAFETEIRVFEKKIQKVKSNYSIFDVQVFSHIQKGEGTK